MDSSRDGEFVPIAWESTRTSAHRRSSDLEHTDGFLQSALDYMGLAFDPRRTSLLSYLLLNARRLEDGIALAQRFVRIERRRAVFTSRTEGDDLLLIVDVAATGVRDNPLYIEHALGAVLAASSEQKSAGMLLNFTAGGFIYIGTVGVMPQLLTETSISQTLKEVCAFGLGVGMMLIVMYYE